MKLAIKLSSVSLMVLLSLAWAQSKPLPLVEEMERLGVHTVLLIPSSAIDEQPIWSPDSRYVAANVAGTWQSIDTSELQLQKATWRHKQPIATLAAQPKVNKIDDATAEEWSKPLVQGMREVTTKSGLKISLTQNEMSTRFSVQPKGKQARTIWQSVFENCHSLALSPDQRFVAFICEQNGVVVADVTRLAK